MKKKKEIFTIGHSTRTIGQFIDLLRAHGVRELADIRTIRRSSFNPQFNEARLAKVLAKEKIGYVHLAALGGLRHAKKDSVNLGWRNSSFRGYADYMMTPQFAVGLDELMALAAKRPTVIMCAEAVPWRCHRSLVADALTKEKWTVRHIQSKQSAPRHTLTPFLRMRKGMIVYPAEK